VTAYDTVTARLTERTGATGRNGTWPCPAHDDSTPSLSVSPGNDGKVLVYCHAGCRLEDILTALNLDATDLFDTPRSNGSDITTTYDYVDEQGTLLFQVVRFAGKQFRQRRPDGNGEWIWKLGDTRRVLYRLPQVVEAVAAGNTVYVVEGEKDADRLAVVGYTATCNPHGAGKWRSTYNASLTGADVVVIADRDKPGREHARDIARHLDGIAATIRVTEPVTGKDISDHLAAGRGIEDLVELDSSDSDDHPFLDWHQLFTDEITDDEWLYEGVFALGRGHAVYAQKKEGKSLFVLWCCAELATTRTDVDIVYLDYEMTRADVRERMEEMGYGAETDLSRFHYDLLPSLPPLDTGEGMAALLELVDRVQRPGCHLFVVIDTTSRAVEGDENSNDTIRNFYRWTGAALKKREITWARLDHAGKDPTKGQRGGSAKGDDVDVIWRLQRADAGITLHRDAARMSWVDEKLTFAIRTDPLRYERTGFLWPAGTKELAATLDRLGVPVDAGRPKAREALKANEITATNNVLAAAIRYRKRDPLTLLSTPDSSTDSSRDQSTDSSADTSNKPAVTRADSSTDSDGQPTAVRGPVSVSLDTDRSNGDDLLEEAFGPGIVDVDPDDYARRMNPGELGPYKREW
jgi:5S rRNA maturation endonuclease (ribonuclease M5)